MTSQSVIDLAGVSADPAISKALTLRADVLEMIGAAEAAILKPEDPGGLPHALRAALAVRIARINKGFALAGIYEDALRAEQANAETLALADPAFDGGDHVRTREILAFTDLVAASPKDATAADIDRLRNAGVAEPDIVRLTQLNAFLAFQIRVVDGLSLMGEKA
jgi:uncharacterized protein YciW